LDSLSFCYWLKGFVEIGNPTKLSELELTIIKDHLDLVFKKETPNRIQYDDSHPSYSPNQDSFNAMPFLTDFVVHYSC